MIITKLPPASKEDLLNWYENENRTLNEIGKMYSVSKTTVGSWFKHYEIPRRNRTLSTANYIMRCKEQWGDKYDYTETNYIAAKSAVNVLCPVHGNFSVQADNHARGKAECPQCQRNKSLTYDRFLALAIEIHGVKYDYTEVVEPSYHAKVVIICRDHGQFEQNAGSHLTGVGCPSCGNDRKGKSQRNDFEDIIARFKEVHGSHYDYSLVEYHGLFRNVKIICPDHGIFEQMPSNHMRGKGCSYCGRVKFAAKKTKTTEWFIEQAKSVYGNIYDYSEVSYIKKKTPVTIICGLHGKFEKTPDRHLRGQGCPECARENNAGGYSTDSFQRNPDHYQKPGYFYVARFRGGEKTEEFIKIGITIQKPSNRWSGTGHSGGYEVQILYTWLSMIGKCFDLEQRLLKEIRSKRNHYWPRMEFGGRTECMSMETWKTFEPNMQEKYGAKLVAASTKSPLKIKKPTAP